ncbi:hypothetical protein ACRN9L_10180 [Shewanella oncorhynchi]|uniref:hypothetical protein n=1 Tax=Shewanella oncorhynchi TaxID=2726434 RepID=UPI003D7B0E4B
MTLIPVLILFLSVKIEDVNFKMFFDIFFYSLLAGVVIHIFSLLIPEFIPMLKMGKNIVGDDRVLMCFFSSCRELSSLYRFNFIFEEPGQAGTIFILYLLLKENISKNEIYLLIVAGFLTVSLFFILMLPLVYIIRSYQRNKNTLFKSIFILLFIYVFFISAVEFLNNEYISFQVERRLVTSNGFVVGFEDNRTNYSFSTFYSSLPLSNLLVGYRMPLADMYNDWVGLSYRNYIIEYGYLNVLIFFSFLFFLVKFKFKSTFLSFLIVSFFVAVFYQRPLMFRIELLGIVILFLYEKRHGLICEGENESFTVFK